MGKVFRLFISENELSLNKKVADLEEKLAQIPVIGILLVHLIKQMKNFKFFLTGLSIMFDTENMDLILKEFNPKTGKPSNTGYGKP